MKRAVMLAAILLAALMMATAGMAQEKELPALEDGQVIMKWGDFEKILKELMKPEAVEEEEEELEPPADYSFRSAAFDVSIGKGFANIKGEYALDVLASKRWVMVPVGDSSSGVHDAMIDGSPALLANQGNVSVLLLGRAPHKLSVSYTVNAAQNPGPNSFYLTLAQVPGAVITLTAPATLSDLAISGAVITSTEKAGSVQTIKAVAGAMNGLSVSYSVPVVEAPGQVAEKLPLKIYSSLELLLTLSDEVVAANAMFNYDIKHAPVTGFTVSVPAGFSVVNVIGRGVSDRWKVAEGKLEVPVDYEVQGQYTLQVLFEQKREKASGEVTIPETAAIGAERESGFVAVETRDSLEVNVASSEGLTFIDSTETPEAMRSRARYPVLYSFRFGKHPFTAKLSVIRHADVPVLDAAIDTINLVSIFTAEGKSVTRVIYEVRNNKRQYLKLDLPEKAEVWSAYLDDEAVKPATNDQGQVLLPLKKSEAGGDRVSFTVEIIYYAPVAKLEKRGDITTIFPKADVPASEMLVTLYLPPKFKYKNFEGDLDEQKKEEVFLASTIMRIEMPTLAVDREGDADSYKEKSLYSKRAVDRQMKMEQEIVDELQSQQAAPPPAPAAGPASGAMNLAQVPDQYQYAEGRTASRGMLPVKFNVPLRGDVHRFSKLLVMDEAPKLTFSYHKPNKVWAWFTRVLSDLPWGLIILCLCLLLAALVIFVSLKRHRDAALARVSYISQAPPPPIPPADTGPPAS